MTWLSGGGGGEHGGPSEARESPVRSGPYPGPYRRRGKPSEGHTGPREGILVLDRPSAKLQGSCQESLASIAPPSFHPQGLAYPEARSSPILASTRGDSPGSSRSSRSSALTTRIPSVSLS